MSRALAARLGAFWLPLQTVLYIGASDASVARRVAAIARTSWATVIQPPEATG